MRVHGAIEKTTEYILHELRAMKVASIKEPKRKVETKEGSIEAKEIRRLASAGGNNHKDKSLIGVSRMAAEKLIRDSRTFWSAAA